VSETDLVSTEAAPAPRKRGGLTGMVLAELRQLAGELNIPGIAGMRKGDLIAAIKEKQGPPAHKQADAAQLPLPDNGAAPVAAPVSEAPVSEAPVSEAPVSEAPTPVVNGAAPVAADAPAATPTRRRRTASRPAGAPSPVAANGSAPVADAPAVDPPANGVAPADTAVPAAGRQAAADTSAAAPDVERATEPATAPAASEPANGPAATDAPATEPTGTRRSRQGRRSRGEAPAEPKGDGRSEAHGDAAAVESPVEERQRDRGRDSGGRDTARDNGRDGGSEGRTDTRRDDGGRGDRDGGNRGGRGDNRPDNRGPRDNRPDDDGDDDGDGRGRRGRRFRDRRRGRDRDRTGAQGGGQAGGQGNVDTEVRDGDVLLPVAGIVDILDNYAFVRTTGYLSGPTDVYVSLSMVRRYGLRRGDAITGAVREPRDGEQSRQKFNPLVRVDSINGQDPDASRGRPEFTKLTPLYPNERLRLETEPQKLTTRVIDLVMPVGKGQRALIVSPPKAGKTTIMQNIANAITTNNPECHLMVVLVDERPEEVTDMQRSVKGEVIASTFDRPPSDHITVAELSIERAKRLVEMGHDVVVLLDNITRLGRAYNLAAPASGRILSGGVDSTALYPPKRFLGAARNIEDGGSLTIFATALVETGSTMDTVIFEEFKGTGNAELKLDRKIADKRVFPAIDVGDSSTRKDELLLSPDEHAVMVKLRRVLAALDDQQAIDLLLTQLRKTRTNIEFLMQVAKSTPGADND
jgi:transcription termination factor Rho